ncbi:MAG TPA: pyruvate ferredoxin oxidoreductase [Candidatus Moranbacteria bacterium]|nr:MAG: Pyruvate synthase subunit PorA [Candidatus Moranbacteria bacterium GW2011_GWF1_34_10]HBI17349.1 pyruvate ferredoxin oxidoreductase [Candidatus Moranbacteria bacterium]
MIPNTKYKIQNTKKVALTGGAASAEALRQINPFVMPVYPITPQTPIIESFAKICADGKADTEIITVESEHSAISAAVGSQAAGVRTVTATSSQGLALMNEILYIASGMRLPIVMLISARALSAPLNIHGDHSDVMGARDTGWIQLFSENVQEVYDNTIIGTRLAEKSELPIMVVMDGFTTSHNVENLELLPDEDVKNFVGEYKNENALLDVEKPVTYGPVALSNSYFEFKLDQEDAMGKVAKNCQEVMKKFKEISERKYDLIEEYEMKDAQAVIVVMGATAGTAKDAVDNLRKEGKKVGLLKIKLFRPFPYESVAKALKNIKSIAVMDRAISSGSMPALYSEINNTLRMESLNDAKVNSYIYGLGGRDVFIKDIEGIFEELLGEKFDKKVKYVK